jgi:hypothetical protein
VEPTVLTVKCVKLEQDRTKKTKDKFNTAYFVEKEIRAGRTAQADDPERHEQQDDEGPHRIGLH